MSPNILKFLVCLISTVRASVITHDSHSSSPSTCNGSLILHSPPRFGSPTVFRTGQLENIVNFSRRIIITKVEVQGCGCFQVFSKKNGGGQTFTLRSEEMTQKGDKTFFRKARSMKRVMCSS